MSTPSTPQELYAALNEYLHPSTPQRLREALAEHCGVDYSPSKPSDPDGAEGNGAEGAPPPKKNGAIDPKVVQNGAFANSLAKPTADAVERGKRLFLSWK